MKQIEQMLTDAQRGTAEAQMIELGKLSVTIMDARIKALKAGWHAMHHEFAEISDEITRLQAELLAANPDLMSMALAAV